MKIKEVGLFHAPDNFEYIQKWIDLHNPDDRSHLMTAAMMTWNLACKLSAMPDAEEDLTPSPPAKKPAMVSQNSINMAERFLKTYMGILVEEHGELPGWDAFREVFMDTVLTANSVAELDDQHDEQCVNYERFLKHNC